MPDVIIVRSPYDDSVIGEIPAQTAADVDRAVAVAKAALHANPLPLWKRAEILDRAAARLTQRREEFAQIIAKEAAKPIKTARVEAERAAGTFQFAAAEARKLGGEMIPLDAIPAGEGKLGFTLRVPIGVVGAIAPFNFPLNLVVHKVGPAIAAGCPVVLKPASQTPFSSIELAKMLIDECGLPAEYLQVVTGGGSTVGNAIVDHPDVALITFTGSPEVGWSIRARAPRKRVGLELGNNAPCIIEADGDWTTAAAKIKVAGFSHAGQSCISTQRVLVHRSIADEFTKALVAHVESLVVGDPLDDATDVSALISKSERDRVSAWVEEARESGATVATGGSLTDDGVLRPTVIANATPDLKVCSQEVFGPVVAVTAYDTLDEAIALANDTKFGLQAAIFTSDISKALLAVRSLDFGGVLVNEVPTWRADQQPYGGLRDSGNTREGPAFSVKEMTEIRMVVLSFVTLRWGVLGGTSGIYRRSLLPAFEGAGHTVVAAPSRDGESLAPYDEMLARDDVDAVYNPLPNHLHAEWTHRALDAGKHVLCEKPLTLSPADTASVFDHAEAAGLTVLEAYMWPHHPCARQLLALVRSGDLGWLQQGNVSFSWPMDMNSGDHRLDLRGAGALFDIGIYCIAPFMLMARRDAGTVAANAVRNRAGVDISMSGWIDWGAGFGSSFHVSFDAPSHRAMGLECSEATVHVPGSHAPGPVEPSELVLQRRSGGVEHVACEGGEAYTELVRHFAAVVAGEQQPVFGRIESERLADVLQRLHVASAH